MKEIIFIYHLFSSFRGNFLYVDLVLNFFKEGKLQVKSTSFGMIPLTLSEVYLLAFNLKFQTQEAFMKVKDILCILAASLKPFTHQVRVHNLLSDRDFPTSIYSIF